MFQLIQNWLLPWAMYAVSIFNLVLLLWLGLTILLNAQERNWGTYLAGSGFLVGALFFLLHTAALNYSLDTLLENSPIWWLILSAPVGALPFGWMILMLWYCGYWDETDSPLRRRTRTLLALATALAVCQLVVVWVGWPKFGASPFTYIERNNITQFVSLRLLLWLYPLFLLCCTGTALLALLRPMPPASWSRQASQKRARPFLLGSSIVQFAVSCAVAAALMYFAMVGNRADLYNPAGSHTALYNVAGVLADWLDATDFALCAGISLAVLLLGKAVVSFEIFTGKVLPRRGFWRQWRAVVILAATYAALIATSLGFNVEGIYPLLLSTCLLGVILAIFSHRAYTDKARATANLAPFVASGHLLGGLLQGDETQLRAAIDEPFRALCEDVLNAGRAMLLARGDIAPLFGAPRFYPPNLPAVAGWAELAARHNQGSEVRSLPEGCGMDYLVPLGEDGNIGALLLGPRRDGGLYTLEEIEIARAAGEHLLDSGAGATLAARLVALQRQKVAHFVTLDRGARRSLHDDILPLLHAALLFPDEAAEKITAAHKGISDLLRELPAPLPLEKRAFFEALQHEVESEMAGQFDGVTWQIAPAAHIASDDLPPFLASTLYFAAREAIRNAARHGRSHVAARALHLEVGAACQDGLQIWIADDGVGANANASSTPTEDKGGSGSGLSLHAALLAVAGGTLSLDNPASGGTRVEMSLPLQN